MAKEAREIEVFLQGIEGAGALAEEVGILAGRLEAAGISKITKTTPQIELPKGIRTETLTIGTMARSDFQQEFKRKGINVSSYTQDLIDKTEFSTKPEEVQLVWQSGVDLGFRKTTPYKRFLEAGQEKGYGLSRAEVGLYLRLQDKDQPLNDWYWMAMEPMTDRSGYPDVFELGHSSFGLWLRGDWADPGRRWHPGHRLVFSLSK